MDRYVTNINQLCLTSLHVPGNSGHIRFLVSRPNLLSFDSDSDSDTDPDPDSDSDYNPYRRRDGFDLY
jgi:hypothetical protein